MAYNTQIPLASQEKQHVPWDACTHTLIMGMNVMVIYDFNDFSELFFFQGGVITQHTSLTTL